MTLLRVYSTVSTKLAAGFLLACAAGNTAALEFDPGLSLGMNGRWYPQSPQFAAQNVDHNLSALAEIELGAQLNSSNFVKFLGFSRHEETSDQLSHSDIRELFWRFSASNYHFLVGYQQVFWGVTESRHLVDVINQTDLLENIDEEDKLGQPIVQFSAQLSLGEFEFYWLPVFREREYPDPQDRFSLGLPINTSSTTYFDDGDVVDKHGQSRHQFALRYSHYIDDWDFGVYYFDGISREPVLNFDGSDLVPHYHTMQQIGVDVQLTKDAWLYKAEFIHRDTQSERFSAAVAGFEYTLFGLSGGNMDLGLLAEYLYDGRDDGLPPTIFQNDLFLATRLAFNDSQDSVVLAGIFQDLEESEMFFSVEASTRIGPSVRVEVEARFFNDNEDGATSSFIKDDYLQFEVSYYF